MLKTHFLSSWLGAGLQYGSPPYTPFRPLRCDVWAFAQFCVFAWEHDVPGNVRHVFVFHIWVKGYLTRPTIVQTGSIPLPCPIIEFLGHCAWGYLLVMLALPPTDHLSQSCKKWFGPSQKVCYKSDLKVVFKWCRPFKHDFWTTFIAYLLGRDKYIKIAFWAYYPAGGQGQPNLGLSGTAKERTNVRRTFVVV